MSDPSSAIASESAAAASGGWSRRRFRAPDFQVESEALGRLADALDQSSQAVLQKLVECALDASGAQWAGVSLLEPHGKWAVFQGRAAASGQDDKPGGPSPLSSQISFSTATEFAQKQSLVELPELPLLSPDAADGTVDLLLVPLSAGDQPIGTLWAVASRLRRPFDAEDARLLQSLARFAAAAFRSRMAQEMAQAGDQQRAELLRRLVTAQEDERLRVSRELHDDLGQVATALQLALHAARDPASHSRPGALQQADALAGRLSRQLHDLAVALRPGVLDDLGLDAAVAQFVESWMQHSGVGADYEQLGEWKERLPAELEVNVYRVVQEALSNVARHAQARRVSVILERQPKQLLAIVEDDGIGFDPAVPARSAGAERRLGLLGMRERMSLVDGSLNIESASGQGTTILARAPILRPAVPPQPPEDRQPCRN